MKKFIALFTLATGFLISPVQGQENCPKINLHGPAGIVRLGETFTYKVTIEPLEKDWPLNYKWSVSSGEIEAGQGTSTILLRQGSSSQTVSVEVLGLPDSACPNTVSETGSGGHLPSLPVKVGSWKKGQAPTTNQQFAEELAKFPDNQGFVFIVREPASTQRSIADLTAVIKNLAKNQISDASRITIVEAEGFEELVEFWRVPPGTENPKCASCKTAECPTLKIVVPDRITTSGDTAKFSLIVDPVPDRPILADWQVSSGTIEQGQGSEKISVRTLRESAGQALIATAQVRSLPSGCDSNVSGVAAVSAIVDPYILLDDWGRLPLNDEKGRLDTIAAEASKRPGSIVSFFIFLSPKEPASSAGTRIDRIREFLTKRHMIAPSRLVFVNGGRRETRTRVYLSPPDAEPFQP